MSDLYKKHPSIKFEFQYSLTKIEFLDGLVYKDHNSMLQTTIYRKQTDRQNYLDARSEHPKLLKDSIRSSFKDKTNLFFTVEIARVIKRFLASSANNQSRNYDTECSNDHLPPYQD